MAETLRAKVPTQSDRNDPEYRVPRRAVSPGSTEALLLTAPLLLP